MNWFGGSALLLLAAAIASGQITIYTTSLPDGAVAVPYLGEEGPVTLYASGQDTSAPILWSVVKGSLPDGLTLSSDGTITGTPLVAGLFSFVVEADQLAASTEVPYSAQQPLTINITGANLAITPLTLPGGRVGVPYSQTFSATGVNSGDIAGWTVATGTLPAGLSLSDAGVLSGTPTTAGAYPFVIRLSDRTAAGPLLTTTQSYTLIVTTNTPLAITTGPNLPQGTVGIAYAQQIVATGGVPQYLWKLETGALPDGVSLDPATGSISGKPGTAGTFNFQLSATDQAAVKVTSAFTLVIAPTLSISSGPGLPPGAVGATYSSTLAVIGGASPYKWSVAVTAGPLPPGLVLDPASGLLSGKPTATGTFQFLAGVADSTGQTASKLLSIAIEGALTLGPASPLPNGTVGVAYQAQFAATGGTPNYAWSVAAGAFPAGLTLDPASGLLSGTPTASGTFTVTVATKDAAQTATKVYSLTIAPLPVVSITGLPDTPTPATQPSLGVALSAPYTVDLTGHASLTFAPDNGSDDPAVQFTTGGRSADFTIPAGATQAVFGSSAPGVQTGTVAGTITITIHVFAAGADVTPTPAPTKVLRIAPASPVITSAKLVASSTGFNLVVLGFATSREVTGATVHLTPVAGTQLGTSDFNIALTTAFTAWYQDPASIQFGSQFSLTIPFTVQNVSNAVTSATVTLTNSQGTSAPANATF